MFGNLPQRLVRRAKGFIHRPKVSLVRADSMIRMGTSYGGWEFIDHPKLHGATIVSAGLGEDASFDVEFASRYGARVVIVDPTPRAIEHFARMQGRLGLGAEVPYTSDGGLDVASYDMSRLTADSLELVRKALWTSNTTVKFFQPPNAEHVSHSITNFQNGYVQDTAYIEVPAMTLQDLLEAHHVEQLELIKLDIEGAETEVLYGMMASAISPNQILVEFDELSIPSPASKEKFETCDAALRLNGYECIYWNGRADFGYAHRRLLRA